MFGMIKTIFVDHAETYFDEIWWKLFYVCEITF